jgi:hypothetical protein
VRHLRCRQVVVDLDSKGFPGADVEQRECTNQATVAQPVVDEIEAPALVGSIRWRRRCSDVYCAMFARLRPQIQALQAIETMHAMLAHRPAFSFQQYQQTAASESRARSG